MSSYGKLKYHHWRIKKGYDSVKKHEESKKKKGGYEETVNGSEWVYKSISIYDRGIIFDNVAKKINRSKKSPIEQWCVVSND